MVHASLTVPPRRVRAFTLGGKLCPHPRFSSRSAQYSPRAVIPGGEPDVWRMEMRLVTTTALLVALGAGAASAAPMSMDSGLASAGPAPIEQVQWWGPGYYGPGPYYYGPGP